MVAFISHRSVGCEEENLRSAIMLPIVDAVVGQWDRQYHYLRSASQSHLDAGFRCGIALAQTIAALNQLAQP